MSTDSLRELIANLAESAGALAVLAAELQSRISGKPIHPLWRPHVEAILRTIGANDALDGVSAEELKGLYTEIRHFWLSMATSSRLQTAHHHGTIPITPFSRQAGI